MKDEEIVALVIRGEKEAFGEIVERYQKKLSFYVRNLINQDEGLIEDLLQEVFVRAYVNLYDFDQRKKFSAWIFRIAHNVSVDWMKKKRVKTVAMGTEEEWWPDKSKLIEELVIEGEKKRELGKNLALLEVKYREILLLYYYEDKSYQEISEILRIPESQVGVRLFRAKKKLKEIYGQR